MPGNVELVLGAAVSVPMSMVNGLIDLLISKGVVSRDEVRGVLQRLIAAVEPGEESEMMKQMLRAALERLEA